MSKKVVVVAGIYVALAGCSSSPQIAAMDGLISSRVGLGSGQTALMNLHSLAVEPGVLVRLPSNNGRATTSAMVEHTSANQSYLRVETYEKTATQQDMAKIRKSIESITFTIGEQMGARIEKAKAASLEQKAQGDLDKTKGKADAVKAEKTERFDSAMQNLLDTAVANNSPLEAISKIETLSVRQPKAAVVADANVQAATATVVDAKARVAGATETAKAGEKKLSDSQSELSEALSKPNIVVFRWNSGENNSGVLNLLGKSETQAQEKRQTTGYAILNGMRRVRLVVGEDLVTGRDGQHPPAAVGTLKGLASAGQLVDSYRGVLVTSVVQTRELMYFTAEDLEQSLKEKLDLKVSDFAGAGLTPEEIANLKIQAELDLLRLRSVQNSGYFTSPRVDMIQIDDWDRIRFKHNKLLPPDRGETGREVLNDPDWITVHAVTTTVDALLDQRRNFHPAPNGN